MRREAPQAEGVYESLRWKPGRGRRPCEHLPRCRPGVSLSRCPHPARLLLQVEAGEPVELAVWQLPGRPGDYGLGPDARVRVYRDDRIERVG